jgi:uncharacterized protein
MSGGWSKPREFARLADMRAEFEYEIPVSELPGLPSDWIEAPATMSARLRFGRQRGIAVADVIVRGELQGTCQRCLQPLRWPVAAESHVALVASEAEAGELPAELESFLAPEGRCELAALVAEEVLLALPIVPHHAEGERCESGLAEAAAPESLAADEAAGHGETQRPFADLRALLERGSE